MIYIYTHLYGLCMVEFGIALHFTLHYTSRTPGLFSFHPFHASFRLIQIQFDQPVDIVLNIYQNENNFNIHIDPYQTQG